MRFQILILGFKGSIRTLRMPSKMSMSIMSKVGGGVGGWLPVVAWTVKKGKDRLRKRNKPCLQSITIFFCFFSAADLCRHPVL